MAKLSRLKKNQELREKIDSESIISSPADVLVSSNAETTSTHAKKDYHPYKQVQATPNQASTSSSPVINDLLMEVKKYNMENGDRVSSDTQINILKSLDEEEPNLRRNNHFLPMEEDEEKLGSTMKLPRTSLEALQHTTDVLSTTRSPKLNRISPLVEHDDAKNEEKAVASVEIKPVKKEQDEISSVLIKPARIEFTEPMIIDSSDLFHSEFEDESMEEDEVDNIDSEMEEDHLEILEFVLDKSNKEPVVEPVKEEFVEEEKPKLFGWMKKDKKTKKEEDPVDTEEKIEVEEKVKPEEVPSKAEEIKVEMVEEPKKEQDDDEEYNLEELEDAPSKGSKALNIILVVLLLALIACTGFVLYTILSMGK
ncbi:MAG: hypothetical protein KBT48_08745 [Firmicutes bacterium]|nr:hypothetical protein [Bacillota bacterium]